MFRISNTDVSSSTVVPLIPVGDIIKSGLKYQDQGVIVVTVSDLELFGNNSVDRVTQAHIGVLIFYNSNQSGVRTLFVGPDTSEQARFIINTLQLYNNSDTTILNFNQQEVVPAITPGNHQFRLANSSGLTALNVQITLFGSAPSLQQNMVEDNTVILTPTPILVEVKNITTAVNQEKVIFNIINRPAPP
jgi:hypothetical protein